MNVNFPDISVGSNTIDETHITEMTMKVAKSIGLFYKLNSFLPETILKTL